MLVTGTTMLFRLALFVTCAVVTRADAADFSGLWAGTATNQTGAAGALHLTVDEREGVISGHVTRGESSAVPFDEAVKSGDDLQFVTRDHLGRPVTFALKFVVFGHPLGDRQVMLRGKATTATEELAIDLYPVNADAPGGNGIDLGPVLLRRVQPASTEQARTAKVEGKVVLRVQIAETGLIATDQIRVLRSLGYGLDEAAIQSVRQWRFRPAFRKGFAVWSAASIEVAFRP